MLRLLLIVLVKGPPVLVVAVLAVYALDLGGGRQPIVDVITAVAHAFGVEMAERITPPMPTLSPTPEVTPAP